MTSNNRDVLFEATEFCDAGLFDKALERAIEAESLLGATPAVLKAKIAAATGAGKSTYVASQIKALAMRLSHWEPWQVPAKEVLSLVQLHDDYVMTCDASVELKAQLMKQVEAEISQLVALDESLIDELMAFRNLYSYLSESDSNGARIPEVIEALVNRFRIDLASDKVASARVAADPDIMLGNLTETDRAHIRRLLDCAWKVHSHVYTVLSTPFQGRSVSTFNDSETRQLLNRLLTRSLMQRWTDKQLKETIHEELEKQDHYSIEYRGFIVGHLTAALPSLRKLVEQLGQTTPQTRHVDTQALLRESFERASSGIQRLIINDGVARASEEIAARHNLEKKVALVVKNTMVLLVLGMIKDGGSVEHIREFAGWPEILTIDVLSSVEALQAQAASDQD